MAIETVENYYWNASKGTIFIVATLANQPVDETVVENMVRISPPPAGNDWEWDGDGWVKQIVDPVYTDLPARQFWLAALSIGITEDLLIAGISDPANPSYIEDPILREETLIDIRKATTFSRGYPALNSLAAAQGIPSEQLDALWLWATGL